MAVVSDIPRQSSVAVDHMRDTLSSSITTLSPQLVDREDISMEAVLSHGQETPTPAGRSSRTAKNKEKALRKRKRREDKRRKSESAARSSVQTDALRSLKQEDEDMLQLSTEYRETRPVPIVNSLVETFCPEVLIGCTVRLSIADGYVVTKNVHRRTTPLWHSYRSTRRSPS